VFNAESQERQHYTEKRHTKRMRMMAIDEKAGKIGFRLIWIHPHLIAEDVSVVVVVEVMMVLALVVHCLMLLVYLLKIICP
jgi:hypothetical protein